MKPINELTPEEWLETMRPPDTKWNVLNLGAGVQSSCLALMAAKGDVGPMPDFAVFADTQAEPTEVYDWLDWLEKQLPFPVYRVTRGNLTEESLRVHQRKDGSGERVNNLIPAFGLLPDGSRTAAIGRKCTNDYKILPMLKKIKEACGVARGQKEVTVTQWIGISWDETQRMKDSRFPWTQHRFPLIEKKMSRRDCLAWMEQNGHPEPPRSACIYCPFHSNTEWRRLRDEHPSEFNAAIAFDKRLRAAHKDHNKRLKMEVFLHNSCKPLDEIDFNSPEQNGQESLDFLSECEGMCGV
jgi:3'-phosphoadenosine 5'-phosphosulfate sulfotransferase (PAPS reductase)/FAD synthetase